jgi:hypothetical protein
MRRLRNINPSAWLFKFHPQGAPRPLSDIGAADLDCIVHYLANPGVDLTASFVSRRGDNRPIERASRAVTHQIVLASFPNLV